MGDVVGYFSRLDGSTLVRAFTYGLIANHDSSPASGPLMLGVIAPVAGWLHVTVSFHCISSTGNTNTRWDIQQLLDGVPQGWPLILVFPNSLGNFFGEDATSSFVAHVAPGSYDLTYQATRVAGNGSLDCTTNTSSLFVRYFNYGGIP